MLQDIILVVVGLLIGAVAGFFIARTVMQKYLLNTIKIYHTQKEEILTI